jgi:hypothetical protein
VPTFTDMFLDYTKDAESPENFFRWSSYACLAAVLRSNVSIDLGLKEVYPNIYVILMARSAAMRKGVPLQLAGNLIATTGSTKVIKGRASIQAVIKELASAETDPRTGQVKGGASGILLSEELASFSPEDKATIPILTDLYDYHEEWSNTLIYAGKQILKKTCVTMLAATNEAFFKEVYTALAIRGGLLGRTFLIRELKRRTRNSLMYEDASKFDKKPLENRLKEISKIKGKMGIDDEARAEYDSWYQGIDYSTVTSDNGVVERIHWGVLKLAILLAVGDQGELVIRKDHMIEAIDRCTHLIKNYDVISMGVGKSMMADATAAFLTFLWERGGKSSIREILRHNWQHFDLKTLTDSIVPTMEGAGYVRLSANNGEPEYELTAKGREIWTKEK